jgi:protein-disulfide isomerase
LFAVVGLGAVALAGGVAWALAVRPERQSPAGAKRVADTASAQHLAPQDLMLEARTRGTPGAPLTIYEASDFQCPYCRQFWEVTLPILERDYIQTGKARFVFLNLPLTEIHANAAAAHEFAMCAARQDRFWPVHDLLYRHQAQWSALDDPAPYFLALADSARVARGELAECFARGSVRWLIQAEAQMNWRAGIRSTPSFIVEGALLPGAQPIEIWRPILDSILATKTAGGRE